MTLEVRERPNGLYSARCRFRVNGKRQWFNLGNGYEDEGTARQEGERLRSEKWVELFGENTTDKPIIRKEEPLKRPDEEVLAEAIKRYERTANHERQKRERRIILPEKPVMLSFLSDLHFGNPGTDYKAAFDDAKLIRDTQDAYAFFIGDGFDNWIVGKLMGLQRGQAVPFDEEMQLFGYWSEIIGEKMLLKVSGNHELWTLKSCGIDSVQAAWRGIDVAIYDHHEIAFDLVHGDTVRAVKVRHKVRGNSEYNPTHGMEKYWQNGDEEFDWILMGHTHIGTLCREFLRHRQKCRAMLIGTYKQVDKYAKEIGFPTTYGQGSGAMVLHPDGREVWVDDLKLGVDILRLWQNEW